MTEAIRASLSERASDNTLLVNRDSATRRARRLAVESDVGELDFVFEKYS